MKKLLFATITMLLVLSGCRETTYNPASDDTIPTNEENTATISDVDGNITQIACGNGYQIYLTSSGSVYASGNNLYGNLGTGDFQNHNGLVKVNIPEPIKLIDDCVAVTQKNDIYIWGTQYIDDEALKAKFTQPEEYSSFPFSFISTPYKIEFGKPIKKIFNSWLYTNILTEDGDVYTFGAEYTGDGVITVNKNFVGDYYPSQNPQKVNFAEKIVDISSGYEHTLALGESGALYGYGSSEFNQLGNRTENAGDYVVISDKIEIGAFAACAFSSFFVDKNDPANLYQAGRLIGDTTDSKEIFTQIKLPSAVVELFPSNENSLIIKCENNNFYGIGTFYQKFYNLTGDIYKPEIVISDVEISEIVRYWSAVYFIGTNENSERRDFYRYDKDLNKSNKIIIDEKDIKIKD